MEIRNGKKPLAAKAASKAAPINMDDIFGNALGLDPNIVKALRDKGLVHRFISAPKLMSSGGYHARGWRPIKLKEIEGYGTIDTFGADPDGYLRRGDLVLAVRSKELNDKHKAYLAQEGARGKNIQKKQADELRQFVKGNDLGMEIIEGYEDEDKS